MTGHCPDCQTDIQIHAPRPVTGPVTYYCSVCEKPVRLRPGPASEEGHSGSWPRILIATVEEEATWSVVRILEEAGYAVRVACDERGALDEVREFAPDIVLLDLRLDAEGGSALLDAIFRERSERPPRVLVVGGPLRSPGAIHRFHERGAAGLIPRPALRETVLFRIQSLLG